MISLSEYWMGRDVKYASELTEEIRANAQIVVDRANQLLERAGAGEGHGVRSGWRPKGINDSTSNAATASRHLTAEAVDLADNDRYLADWAVANLAALVEVGCWMESPQYTPTWVHWQIVPPRSGKRIYIPSLAKPLDPDYPVTWA